VKGVWRRDPLLLGGFAAALLAIATASPILLSEDAGSIAGRVTDETGAGLPGVAVEARSSASEAKPVSTDREGGYEISGLRTGVYDLSFRLPSFAPQAKKGVTVEAGRTHVDVVLHLSVSADVVVTGKKSFSNLADVSDAGESLVGIADAATQGTVGGAQIDERPIARPGEVLETVPGLVISQHSGDGKANQYYLRGFNLDHGTDFATTVAGIPINLPSHAHGQGYTDLNFVIPELVSGVQYQKGPYSARDGDFSTAGSASIHYVNELERGFAGVVGGDEGYARVLYAQSPKLGEGTLLYAFEFSHDNGPWVNPDDAHKYNGVLRYSQKNGDSDFSVTAMGYQNRWNSTDQVPDRAVSAGTISKFGAVDPTDGGDAYRYSLAADWQKTADSAQTRVTAYAVDSHLRLFSNFTYDLNDPVNGDQFEQLDQRVVAGLKASQSWYANWFGMEAESTVGIQARNDNVAENGLFHTRAREVLSTTRLDHVTESSIGLFFETSLRWSSKFRTVLGLRGDAYHFRVSGDDPANSGTDHAGLLSPKLSLILGPWANTEFYANVGYGFHSNDARGTTITRDPQTHEPAEKVTPLARAKGAEIGIRSVLVPHLQTTLALWGLDLDSELVFTGDAGTTEPSRPSRRDGIELANYYSPLPGVTLDADLALSKARYRDFDPVGNHVPGAIETVLSAGVSADAISPFFGSVRVRYFGPRPLIEDNSVRSESSTLWNVQMGYEIVPGARLVAEVLNVFNASASDIDYYYASRLPGEPAAGVDDIHTHPSLPRTMRVGLRYAF
jgi:TonB-dependent receptor-like protein/carboxypeptidase family protein